MLYTGRPAFDCQGSVTIAFSKSNRAISVKYEHTLFHKSVAQLLELFAPPPAAAPLPVQEQVARKLPKTPKARRQTGGPQENGNTNGNTNGASGSKKRRNTTEGGGQPKRRKNKKDGQSQAPQVLEADMQLPEVPGALPVGSSSERPLYNTQSQLTTQEGTTTGAITSSSYPEGLVGASASGNPDSQTSAAVTASGQDPSALNLPPGEAQRRRDAASQLLSSHDIDPQTLSEEQFNIFANQSPDLQKESLAMLAKYGAERLRIVHPSRETAAQPTATVAPQSHDAQAGPGGGDPVGTSVATTASGKPKKPSKRKSAAAAANSSEPPEKRDRTRGACEFCRDRKMKCDRFKPACTRCVESGLTCIYQTRKSGGGRKRKKGQTEEDEATEVDGESGNPLSSGGPLDATTTTAIPTHGPAPEPTPSSPTMDQSASSYPDPSIINGLPYNSSLTFPSQSVSNVTHPHGWTAVSGVDYSHMDAQHSASASPSVDDIQAPASLPYAEQTAPARPPNTATHDIAQSQHDLSNVHAANRVADLPPSWPATYSEHVAPTTVTTVTRSPKQPKPRRPNAASAYNSRNTIEGLRQAAELPQPSNKQPARPSPAVQAASFPRSASTSSRDRPQQGTRAPTRTPVQNKPVARQPQATAKSSSSGNSAYPTPAPSQSSNYNSFSRSSGNETAQASNRTPYGSYTQQPSTTAPPSYPTYDAYNSQSQSSTTPAQPTNPVTHDAPPSYVSTASQNTNQWGGSTSTPQATNPPPYNVDSSNSTDPSYNTTNSTSGHQSPATKPFEMPPRGNAQHHSMNNSYGQQQQQQHSQSSYASYAAQQPNTTNQQDNWYVVAAGAGNNRSNAATGYPNTASHVGGHYGHQHQHQQHQAMNLSGHTYSSMENGDQAIYNLLRGSPGT